MDYRDSIKKLALFSKPNSPHAWGVLQEVIAWATQKGFEVLPVPPNCGWDGQNWNADYCAQARANADLGIAIGGDGTLLGVARSLFGWGKPVLGINLGHLGFLTDVAAKDIEKMLDDIAQQNYTFEHRILLESKMQGSAPSELAFNDVVFRADMGRLAEYDIFVDDEPVFSMKADGFIIATPTGSTAYALSANGPILHPSLAAIALVPLCPHSLTARPITLPSKSKVEVVGRGNVTSRVYCDGQPYAEVLNEGSRVVVQQASTTVKMLHLQGYSLYKTLQQKLQWSVPHER